MVGIFSENIWNLKNRLTMSNHDSNVDENENVTLK